MSSGFKQMLLLKIPAKQGIIAKSEGNEAVIVPGYAHLQWAQPVLPAHHLLAGCRD